MILKSTVTRAVTQVQDAIFRSSEAHRCRYVDCFLYIGWADVVVEEGPAWKRKGLEDGSVFADLLY